MRNPMMHRSQWPALAAALLSPLTVRAETNSISAAPTALPEVVVTGRADSLVGIAESASQGTVGAVQLDQRPKFRPGEVLETVPGLIATQHSGAGKANQYYLRGFNLDHGTDFATSLEGMPLNLPTHAHGQGYTDMNPIIPELVERINFRKGPYFADGGDFSSAGAADIQYFRSLPEGIARFEAGSFNYFRGLVADSQHVGEGDLLYGLEGYYNDGPWTNPDEFKKGNAVLRYSRGDHANGWSVMGTAYKGKWNATDQIAERALALPGFDRWSSLDDTTGGDSQRFNLIAEWHRADDRSRSRVTAYGFYYDLDLFSDFTYFLDDPVNGDQFEQQDRRWVAGLQADHTWTREVLGLDMDNTVGLDVRSDFIRCGLYHTADRVRLSTTRADDVTQVSVSPYVENQVRWTDWLRSYAGVRLDSYFFDVNSDLAANSGTRDQTIVSPKLGVVFGPWAKTEFYLNGGLGFHSNDGRGTTTTIEPGSGDPVSRVDPLVRTYGAEAGVRTTWIEGLQSSVAIWWLDIDSELLFVGDAGSTEPSRRSRRCGIEFANYYSPTKWLTFDADFSWSHARFRDDDPAGNYIPGSPEMVIAAGATVHDLNGFFGSIRLRYFGPRPLIEDNSITSSETALVSAEAGYQLNKHWSLSLQAFNLLDRKDSDIDYYYTSRLPGEPAAGVDDIHFHPAEPFALRGVITCRF
jgi:hypothetical protein